MLNKIKNSLRYYYIKFIHNNFIISNLRGFKHLWKLGDVVNGYVDYCKFKHTINTYGKKRIDSVKKELDTFIIKHKKCESFNNYMFDCLEKRIDFVEGMVEDEAKKNKLKDDEPIKMNYRSIGEEEALRRVAKVLSAYDNDAIENNNIDDIVDDIDDEFIGFKNLIYNNINLGN